MDSIGEEQLLFPGEHKFVEIQQGKMIFSGKIADDLSLGFYVFINIPPRTSLAVDMPLGNQRRESKNHDPAPGRKMGAEIFQMR